MQPKLFGREPTLWINAIGALLALAVGFGLPGVNDALVAGVSAFLTAAAAAWMALRVTPIAPAVFTGVVTSGATLLAAFGLSLTQQQVSLVTAAAAVLVSLVARGQVTPVHDPQPSLRV